MKEGMRKDEWRYVYYAQQLLQGEYSPYGTVFLWNGPGYPLMIALFMAVGIPVKVLKILNAFFLYFALIYFFRSLSAFFSKQLSFIATVLLGAYWPAYEMLPYLMTEPYVIFLMTLLLWNSIKLYKPESRSKTPLIIVALLFALLALTKVIFGYVLMVMIVAMLIWLLIKKNSMVAKTVVASILGLVFCLPYLIYTYNISGKVFYWSNAGGMQLYWMSTPYKGEFGDWINFTSPVSKQKETNEIFRSRHGEIIKELFDYPRLFEKMSQEDLIVKSNLDQDEGFMKYALTNIKNHPGKYLGNWFSNVSRMLFDIPYSYRTLNFKFLKYLIPHIPLLGVLLFGFFQLISGRQKLPIPLIILIFFIVIYLGGSSLVSAYPRQFYITIPILGFWIAFIIAPYIKTWKLQ